MSVFSCLLRLAFLLPLSFSAPHAICLSVCQSVCLPGLMSVCRSHYRCCSFRLTLSHLRLPCTADLHSRAPSSAFISQSRRHSKDVFDVYVRCVCAHVCVCVCVRVLVCMSVPACANANSSTRRSQTVVSAANCTGVVLICYALFLVGICRSTSVCSPLARNN